MSTTYRGSQTPTAGSSPTGQASNVTITDSAGNFTSSTVEGALAEVLTIAAAGTGYQPLDAGLTSISGLTTAADKMIYTTASDTYAVTALTAFGRSILDDADAATARATLGLGSISTQAANNVAITGGSVAGITDLAIADGGTGASTASDARTNLGLGSIATQDASSVAITGGTINGPIAAGGTWTAAAAWTLPAYTLGGTVTLNGQSFSGTCADGGTFTTIDINGGTWQGTIDGNWTATGQTCADLGTVTTADINGGTIDNVDITIGTGSLHLGNDQVMAVDPSGSTVTGGGSWDDVVFATTNRNVNGAYNSSTGVFTASKTGPHHVTAALTYLSATATDGYRGKLVTTGTVYPSAPEVRTSAAGSNVAVLVTASVYMTASSTLKVQGRKDTSGAGSLSAVSYLTVVGP